MSGVAETIKVLVVGQCVPDFGAHAEEFEVVGVKAATFPASARECIGVIDDLTKEATLLGAKLLFHAPPGQVAVALGWLHATSEGGGTTPIWEYLSAKGLEWYNTEEIAPGVEFRRQTFWFRQRNVGVIVDKPSAMLAVVSHVEYL